MKTNVFFYIKYFLHLTFTFLSTIRFIANNDVVQFRRNFSFHFVFVFNQIDVIGTLLRSRYTFFYFYPKKTFDLFSANNLTHVVRRFVFI